MKNPPIACLIIALLMLGNSTLFSADELPQLTPVQAAVELDKPIAMSGVVADVGISPKGTVFLNFGAPFPNQIIAAVIMPTDTAFFDDLSPDLKALKGAKVKITGIVQMYEGKPRIIINMRNNLEVLEPAPPAAISG